MFLISIICVIFSTEALKNAEGDKRYLTSILKKNKISLINKDEDKITKIFIIYFFTKFK